MPSMVSLWLGHVWPLNQLCPTAALGECAQHASLLFFAETRLFFVPGRTNRWTIFALATHGFSRLTSSGSESRESLPLTDASFQARFDSAYEILLWTLPMANSAVLQRTSLKLGFLYYDNRSRGFTSKSPVCLTPLVRSMCPMMIPYPTCV